MLQLKRFIIPCALLLVVGIIALKRFSFYRKKPFYVRLKNRRNRQIYRLHNIRIDKSSINGEVSNDSSGFTFSLSFFPNNVINVKIDDPVYLRYRIKDVIILDPENIDHTELNVEERGNKAFITYKESCIKIDLHGLEMHIYYKDDLILKINPLRYFAIEGKEPNVGISSDFLFPEALRAYGLPQHAEFLSLKATRKQPYRLFNTDRYGYAADDHFQSLYGSVPLVYAHGGTRTTGLFWLNASETYVELQNHNDGLSAVFYSESGVIDYFILTGPHFSDCVKQYTELTGVVPLPPLFALGYHQCRFSYMTQDEVKEVSDKFDENNIPLDSIWLDIDYTDDKKYFTWNPNTYGTPNQLLEYLEKKKRKAVVIIDPHIKVDDNYSVYEHCKKEDFFVKESNQKSFVAKCWPGDSSWIDFFNPDARKYYANLHHNFARARNLHIWNDMNEPALFQTNENTMPKNLLHFDNWKHKDLHNMYGFYQTVATYEGLLQRLNLRPFVLTRSHFAGSQRFAAIWTGDNTAEWDHLKISIPMCLTASLAGFSLCGADIGGFIHEPSKELLQRWYQLGTWLPFFRGHSNRNVPRREPYLYSEEIQRRLRNALQERYKHLLHWYTLFWQHYTTLEPVIRPLIYQYPNDQYVLDLDNQFLVGKDILISPIMDIGQKEIIIYLPGGDKEIWYHLTRSKIYRYKGTGFISLRVNMDSVPVFYRGGSIIPVTDDFVRSSASVYDHPISLYIFCDNEGNSTGSLYSDDMESFDYLRNVYSYLRFQFKNGVISGWPVNQNSSYDQSIILNTIKIFGYCYNVKTAELETNNFSTNNVIVSKSMQCLEITNINIDIQENFVVRLEKE